MKNITTILFLCFLHLAAFGADLSSVATQADAIVVGTLQERAESPTLVSFKLTVERVIKGTLLDTTINVSHPWIRRGVVVGDQLNVPLRVVVRGIWFLRRVAGSDWDVLPSRGPDGLLVGLHLPAAEGLSSRFAQPPGSVEESLVLETAAGAEATDSWRGTVQLLKSSKSSAGLKKVLAAYLASPNPNVQIVGVSLSLAQSDQNAIAELIRIWPFASASPLLGEVMRELRDSYRENSPGSIAQLATIVTSPSFSELRSAAVHALVAIHSTETLPTLGGLLESSAPDERMKGVFGLSSFANGCPIQREENVVSMEYLQCGQASRFRTPETVAHFAFRRGPAQQEEELVAFWRNWWIQNKTTFSQR
ncbi:MAG: hypothetical protein NTZ56_01705 [Acidobacteria bacterium]|nr:hypothetical protein [Acidobacteriota bacterium]